MYAKRIVIPEFNKDFMTYFQMPPEKRPGFIFLNSGLVNNSIFLITGTQENVMICRNSLHCMAFMRRTTGDRWIFLTKSQYECVLWYYTYQMLNKESSCRWFETLRRSYDASVKIIATVGFPTTQPSNRHTIYKNCQCWDFMPGAFFTDRK